MNNQLEALYARAPRRIPHWEHWSNPDAETYLSGIDCYDHPRLCRLKLQELYPELANVFWVPASDAPNRRPSAELTNSERQTARWGGGETGSFAHGEKVFKTAEDVFAFSPLENPDFRRWPHVAMAWDYTSEEGIYQMLRKNYPAEWTACPPGEDVSAYFYNTMFMWPMLTFGWELFLECCLDDRFERIMAEFLELNRRAFRAMARLPIRYVTCHDDIVMTRGPVCSPPWMRKYIYSAYEELWGILKAGGKDVVFQSDGCLNECADNIMALGVLGINTEPYTDFKRLAKKYPNRSFSGEGDNRVLMRNNPAEIRAMVESMVETARMCDGYLMCVGNHIPWNVPGEACKRYFDLSKELAVR